MRGVDAKRLGGAVGYDEPSPDLCQQDSLVGDA